MSNSQKEWKQQADAYLGKIMRLLKLNDEGTDIIQDKALFFKVFSEAYHAGYCIPRYRGIMLCENQRPRISGGTIWEFAEHDGWVHSEMTEKDKRFRDIEMVSRWWDEWVYAWKQYVPGSEYKRQRSVEVVERSSPCEPLES